MVETENVFEDGRLGPAPRDACVTFVAETWTDMRPARLREKFADTSVGRA